MVKYRKKESVFVSYEEKFSLLVCAHNEEMVVGEIVENLNNLDYPKDLYDVYVICDNCTDKTAQVVLENGGIPMERFNDVKRGKGYAIEWMLEEIGRMESSGIFYDSIAIFDADNLVSRNFLKKAAEKLNQGYDVAQAYLDSKNHSDNWITKSYAFSYWATARIFQLIRDHMGLSAQLGGTGMIFKTSLLKKLGWGTESLTEDLEFTAKYIFNTGRGVGWIHEAKIYDEKPLKMKQSYVQRTRWMKGHYDCAFRYAVPLLKKFLKEGSLLYIDMFVYLFQPLKNMFSTAPIGFFLLSIFHPLPHSIQTYVLNPWLWLIVIGIYYFQIILGLVMEGKSKAIRWFLGSYIFSITWLPIVIVAFFRRKEKTWNHTKHTRSIKASELEAELGVKQVAAGRKR